MQSPHLKTHQEKKFCHQRENGACWKRVPNVGYSWGKCKRSELNISLQLTALWSSNPVWSLHFHTPTWSSAHTISVIGQNYCVKCQISSQFNQTNSICSSQRQPQGFYQRSSGITAALVCHQRDFQVCHVTGWKPMLFPGVRRLYFTWWSGRTKEQVSPLQHIT